MKKVKAKPCPLCGSKLDLITNEGRPKGEPKRWHPCCHNEKCVLFLGDKWYDTQKEAIEAWNRLEEYSKHVRRVIASVLDIPLDFLERLPTKAEGIDREAQFSTRYMAKWVQKPKENDRAERIFTPEEVRGMSREEVSKNYKEIMQSMPKWK